ncbi:MAG: hypothetical protein JSV36_11195 [Anaerolineae bacterium]|nr:MAG: hypothetical protein JSV36_11195 [Anaerolineae bacterium]
MKTLITYFSETGNTAKVARAIYEVASSRGHEVHLKEIGEITPESLNAYDLVFLGSACHDADLARPVKKILAGIAPSPRFKLAGFATHASYTPGGSDREQEAYERWASGCCLSFRRVSQEKEIDFLGYFGCQGAPSPPIEAFIHNTIVTDEDEWRAYIEKVRKHPNEEDLRKAQAFARQILASDLF